MHALTCFLLGAVSSGDVAFLIFVPSSLSCLTVSTFLEGPSLNWLFVAYMLDGVQDDDVQNDLWITTITI